MSKIRNNQAGFGAILLLLGLVFVAIVLLIGVHIVHNHSNNKTVVTKTSVTSRPTKHTSQEAVSFTQTTYNDYLIATNKVDPDNMLPIGLIGLAAVKNDLTNVFYARASASQNGSSFSCAAQFEPSGYTASLASSNGTSATVAVTISNSSDGSVNTTGMTVNVELSSLKITSVKCPS